MPESALDRVRTSGLERGKDGRERERKNEREREGGGGRGGGREGGSQAALWTHGGRARGSQAKRDCERQICAQCQQRKGARKRGSEGDRGREKDYLRGAPGGCSSLTSCTLRMQQAHNLYQWSSTIRACDVAWNAQSVRTGSWMGSPQGKKGSKGGPYMYLNPRTGPYTGADWGAQLRAMQASGAFDRGEVHLLSLCRA